jgi:tRNA-specific 2-thiouridylase
LFATTQEQLDFLRFPLGDMTKPQTRALAQQFGLEVADKPDSQDICFVPNGDYASVITKMRPGALTPGKIVHLDGRVLGDHMGIINYKVGQRKGLGLGGAETQGTPLYVVALRPDRHEVVVGPQEALARNMVWLKETNWLGATIPPQGLAVDVKLRSVQAPAPATIFDAGDGKLLVQLAEPLMGISAGQACVCYAGQQVLGGGWIDKTALSH